MGVEDILNEREKTHGCFADHAEVTQSIKIVINCHEGSADLSLSQAEALDMIAHKIGRILAGNPNVRDHWDDIAGYATLISRELQDKK